MKLSSKQQDQLWGEGGPYSESRVSIETRILDKKVSRTFVSVEVSLNPLTYKIISENIHRFENDNVIQAIIIQAHNEGPYIGYVAQVFIEEYRNQYVMRKAKKIGQDAEAAIIRMHEFVMDLLDL